MAVAHAAVKALIDEGMVENSRVQGKYLLDGLRGIGSPLVKEIRGRGLFLVMEMHDDTIERGAPALAKILRKHGLLSKASNTQIVRIAPALVIQKHEVEQVVDIFAKALKELEAM